MAHIAEHIQRIADFVQARIDEQFQGELATRYFDTEDPVARLLRGMRRSVEDMRSKTALVKSIKKYPDMAMSADLAMTYAWGELASIAQEWDDHPDYLPEFKLLAHQLEDLPDTGTAHAS